MSIHVSQDKKVFSLHTKTSTYQMQVGTYGHLLHLYYGSRIEESMEYLLCMRDRGFSGNPYDAKRDRTYSMDSLPQEFPTEGTGDFRTNCLSIKHSNGTSACDLRYVGYKMCKGKYAIPGLPAVYGSVEESQTLEIDLLDTVNGIKVTLLYGIFEEIDIITRSVRIENCSEMKQVITRILTSCVDYMHGSFDWIHFYGRHAMEQQPERVALHHGIQTIQSKRGASSHQHNPFFIVSERLTTEDHGSCYGFSFVYSGNFKAEIELDQYDQTRVVLGIQDEGFAFELLPKEHFMAPEVILSYSSQGLTQLSHNYHKILRHNVCRGKYKTQPRPVLINNWEATYFDFDGDKIIHIASQAAKLGVEMFVLDDGWFGERDADDKSLGDWVVNEKKLGCQLHSLVQRINQLGMKFGIWFEPEMISENSELFRKHPDWAFTIPGRNPVRSRHQLVLDFSRGDVVEYVYEQMCNILDSAPIDYIKWDFNRSISDVHSLVPSESHGYILHRYLLGLYQLLERLIQRYPDLLIESCSGGGGRYDVGMLHYSPQIWASDNTDAINRLRIQEGISYGYPISSIGSHVSAVPNHQTRRVTPFNTRGIVAMAGNFGYELDLATITNKEKVLVKQQIQKYHTYWHMIHDGLYYRLTSSLAQQDFAAWQCVSVNQEESLVSIVLLESFGNPLNRYVQLKGLLPNERYKEQQTGVVYLGSSLMKGGIPIPKVSIEYEGVQLHFKRVI